VKIKVERPLSTSNIEPSKLEYIDGRYLPMVLTSIRELLKKARLDGYAVPCFNFWNLTSLRAIITAAEEKRSPVILALYERVWEDLPIDYFSIIGRREAEISKVPIALHLDHGSSMEVVLKCVQRGFNSVMIDGSNLSLKDNIALTREVVDLAHKLDIGVEGELGRTSAVGPVKTDPVEAAVFVEETGVDSLSVSIGNVSGMAEGTAEIDFDLLEKIRMEVSIPLVLHGGTGIPVSSVRKAIETGISKINVGHALFRASVRKANQTLCSSGATENAFLAIHAYSKGALEEIKKVAEGKIAEFGSTGRA